MKRTDDRLFALYTAIYAALVGTKDGKPRYVSRLAMEYATRGLRAYQRNRRRK